MHRPHYAKRQHLVQSFDNLLYQLHTLSFFFSPSVWGYVFRILSQFQCSKPKDIDLAHSLRFYCAVIFTLNLPNFYMHLVHGASEGRAVILDFVGMSYTPSRLQLFSLDLLILFLQLLLITISYETAAANVPERDDILLPNPPSTPLPSGLPTPITSRPPSPSSSSSRRTSYLSSETDPLHSTKPTASTVNATDDIIDLRLQPLMMHLRNPPPPIVSRADGDPALIPLPNTTSVRLPNSLRMLVRTQAARARRNTAEVISGGQLPRRSTAPDPGGRRENRFPGAMDED
ncbi:hypothetical protein D9611_003832 [Ephemerocybe angulata]|uniref:DUF1746 domain-containing protein n=1 Tax=Ephemerocybe angulata TaxID=980116 RepID=A0A8H5B5D2_9AGAR|nr:hypothetical protein D9611_003832 [Tulosesus angulatus]